MLNKLLIPFLVFLTSSCSTTYVSDSERPDQVSQRVEMNTIVFSDHSLNQTKTRNILGLEFISQDIRVSIQNRGLRFSDAGTMEVWLLLKNHTDHPIQLEGRSTFFDNSQAPTEPQSAWKRFYIPANATATYQEFAVSRHAAYYQVELREGR